MPAFTLNLENLGQITKASLTFGDLTVLVGPQASGKSIALQMLKLAIDAGAIQEEMARYGLDWSGNLPAFLDAYFGEGMRALYKDTKTRVQWEGRPIDLPSIAQRRRKAHEPRLFFIPAQRVLTLRDGWPRPFTDYQPGDPFAVRDFSEQLRTLAEREVASGDLFPQARRLKSEFRDLINQHVFSSFSLKIDKVRSQKRLVLGTGTNGDSLPYMVWSAGQREFVPLLLGLYWLMPPTKVSRRSAIEWVVLEELEMGLHPRAIAVVLLLVFELLLRGYKVCLSTHSPQVLDAMWALKHLRESGADASVLLDVFDAPKSAGMLRLADAVLKKNHKVHYFDRNGGVTRDISDLDPSSEFGAEAGWGGLTEFSSRANDAVARAVANAKS